MRKALIAMATVFATSGAHASNWHAVTTSGETAVGLVDQESLVRKGASVRAWVMWSFTEPQTTPGYQMPQHQSVKTLYMFDCSEKTSRTIQVIFYAGPLGQGAAVNSLSFTSPATAVVPDTAGENMLKFVCSPPTKKGASPPGSSL